MTLYQIRTLMSEIESLGPGTFRTDEAGAAAAQATIQQTRRLRGLA